MPTSLTHFTPDQLILRNSKLSDAGWNPSIIGTVFTSGLVLGERKNRDASVKIALVSFIALLEYSNDVLSKQAELLSCISQQELDYSTPAELMEAYPGVHLNTWNASKIGIFLSVHLLIGKRNGKEYKANILDSSFLALIEYAKGVTAQQRIYYD